MHRQTTIRGVTWSDIRLQEQYHHEIHANRCMIPNNEASRPW
jgi:hypothetical protein